MQIRSQNILTADGWLEDGVISIEDNVISAIEVATDKHSSLPTQSGKLIPGFVDVQVNGGGGVLFNQTPDVGSLKILADAHYKFGTTALLPTLITDKIGVMEHAAEAIAEAITCVPQVVGVHFEGPCLSAPKKGVHSEQFIRSVSDKELAVFLRKDIGSVLVTLAPENVSADIIKELTANGVKVCLGHSNADAETVMQAIEAGADGFTHLFNAMSPFQSREPGMVGSALYTANTYCGLILDHYHVHPMCSELAIKVKGKNHIMLVTDAMAHVGTDATELPFFDTTIGKKGDKLTTPNGTLAGSNLDMLGAMVNAHRDLNQSLEDAIYMASTSPAEYLGLEQKIGKIQVGNRADLLLLNDDLTIKNSWLCGKQAKSEGL